MVSPARGTLTQEDFRHFTFTIPVELHARVNPGFFKGTVCESAVEDPLHGRK